MNRRLDSLLKILSLLLVGFSLLPFTPWAFAERDDALIIDHNCTNISQIPEEWINIVKTMVLHHTGQSHGRQVPHGFENVESTNPEFGQIQSEQGIPSGTGLKITCGQLSQYGSWNSGVGPEEYWQGESGKDWTRRTLDYHLSNGDTVHASLHTWCWHMRTWTEAQVDDYLASMEILEAEYPDVTFIYMTDTCDSSGDTGHNRWLRNEQIRRYCIDNNKVLFDFGELETWAADGTEQNRYYHAASGQYIPYWHNDWRSDPFYSDGHINEAACTMKAKAMWWLLARLAGWNPDGGGPVANFSGTPLTGTVPLEVSFTDSSTGEVNSWLWDFDNDGTEDSTNQNPTHTYTNPGMYTVTLEVSGPDGTDTETKTNYITVTEVPVPPVANFSGTPLTGTVPLEVSFTDSSTGEIDSWSWSFGDGGTSTDQNPTHTYDSFGTYTVTLEVTGSGGSDISIRTNYITVTDEPTQHTLTVNVVGEGSVSFDPAGGNYRAGTEVQLTPISDEGWAFNGWTGDLSGYSNPATILMSTDKTITATFDEDSDADGISDAEEDAGPNGADGNSDGVKDSDQLNVATFHTQDGSEYITLESELGTTLADCRAVSTPSAPGAPSHVKFPYDFLNFTINGVGAGNATTLILYLPAGANPTTYWKYGPTPNSTLHWYEFMYDPVTQTGGTIDGNKITLHFVDGERGDNDYTANGIIIEQGGAGTTSSSDGNSSFGLDGSCFIGTAVSGSFM